MKWGLSWVLSAILHILTNPSQCNHRIISWGGKRVKEGAMTLETHIKVMQFLEVATSQGVHETSRSYEKQEQILPWSIQKEESPANSLPLAP